VIHKQYEFVKYREYANGTIQWRCRLYQKTRCHARLTTKGHDIVSDCDPEHNHGGNKESALVHLAVNEMKEKVGELSATPTARCHRICKHAAAVGCTDCTDFLRVFTFYVFDRLPVL